MDALNAQLGEHADRDLEREDHDGDRGERGSEVRRLPDEGDADQSGGNQGQEDRDAGEQLALDRGPGREQAPVLGRQQLGAQLR
jgi:hypothetical protein